MKYSSNKFTWFKKHFRDNSLNKLPKDWKKHLISLYIIRKSDGICLFSHHFQLGAISQIENQLVGMGFTALAKMMREIVDKSARLNMIDLGRKKVLIEERINLLVVLVTTEGSSFLIRKLEELTDHFENMFELQQQINLETCVRLEDYALTSELVSLVFKDRPKRVLEIIPVIFKSIRRNNTTHSNQGKKLTRIFTVNNLTIDETKASLREKKRVITENN